MNNGYRQYQTIIRAMGYGSLGLLGLLALALISPISPSTAQAALPELTAGQDAKNLETNIITTVQSVISIALDSRVDVDVVPKSSGSFLSASARLAVSTNNASGYGIYLNTTNGSQDLKYAGDSSARSITPVSGVVDPNSFPLNTWGYKLTREGETATGNQALYQAVPGTTTLVRNLPLHLDAETKDNFELSFGTMVGTNLEAGAYTNSVMVSVVSNPREIRNLTEAVYMQELDGTRNPDGTTATPSQICAQSTVGMTRQLIDLRDGKKYWVAKLADNNCWMTQNLALDLSTDTPLVPETSDVAASWTPTQQTETSIPYHDGTVDYGGKRSWNLGEYVVIAPKRRSSCNITAPQILDSCTALQKVTTWQPSLDTLVDGTYEDYTGPLSIDVAQATYSAHYLLGNYYQWNTATAGTGNVINDANAVDSVCPKGWSLPTKAHYSDLSTSYGSSNKDLIMTPPAFVQNGYINTYDDGAHNLAFAAYYWTSTAITPSTPAEANSRTYVLYFDIDNQPSIGHNLRSLGLSVRCVAR